MTNNELKMYLVERSIINKETGCWEWDRAKMKGGYGAVGKRNIEIKIAHRLSYFVFFGSIPKGLLVCHKCDNPKCINPDHLFVGTYKDNSQDMVSKGRRKDTHGKNNPFYGKKHTREAKEKVGFATKKRQLGNNNSMYGVKWLYSNTEQKNKVVKIHEVDNWVKRGWKIGRKMEF